MDCPDCGKPLNTVIEYGVGEYLRCGDCPITIPFEELFDLIANVITGKQLQDIVNFTVDLGYDIEYVEKGYFKKVYRPKREGLVDVDLPPNND